ncbi:SNARE domain-containing protein [Phanerochaete sordida]|uniref:SNARE domain-containing protein n=1 Tax=Phanerochaete sordida TaxID=48140 RepID=A0A9P3GDM3_9APHY|nr:SNARE domain-containing protein [Phanerochaete sordida]
MSYQVSEQVVHDRINLLRLVRKLEKSVDGEEWLEDTREPSRAAWIKTQGVMQKLKYARRLLKNVELNHDLDESSSSTERYDELRRLLDRLDLVVRDVNDRVAPKAVRPPAILASLPLPALSARQPPPPSISEVKVLDLSSSADPVADLAAQDLLLSPSDSLPPSSSLPLGTTPFLSVDPSPISEKPSTTGSASTTKPAFLQNSAALQEEMSEQLAAMAAQLKRNAMHFAGALDADKAVVQAAQEKLERNHDVMSKERVRLRDHRSKSWGTTWLVILSMVVAVVGFIMTFFIIKFT